MFIDGFSVQGYILQTKGTNQGPTPPPAQKENKGSMLARMDDCSLSHLKLPDRQQNWELGRKVPSTEGWLHWIPTSQVSM